MKTTELSLLNLNEYLNKTIFFSTPNGCGLAKIRQVDLQKYNPITSDTLSGCNLDYAFKFIGNDICYCDGDRYISVVVVENPRVIKALIELNLTDGVSLVKENQIKINKSSITSKNLSILKSLGATIEEKEEDVRFDTKRRVIIATF